MPHYMTEAEFRSAINPFIVQEATPKEIGWGRGYGRLAEGNISAAWHIYNAGRQAEPVFLLGRLDVGGRFFEDSMARENDLEENPRITTTMDVNIGRATEESGANSGGILKVREEIWSILVNDAFILGAIHSRKDIFFASKFTFANILNLSADKETRPLIVMGRELIGIVGSEKYEIVSFDDYANIKRPFSTETVKFTKGKEAGQVAVYKSSLSEKSSPAEIFFGFGEYLGIIQEYLANPRRISDLCTL